MSEHSARLLYIGQTYRGKKLQQCWYNLETVTNDGSKLQWVEGHSMLFKKTRPYGCKPGTIFTFDTNEDCSLIYPTTARDMGHWQNLEDVARWEVEHKAAEHMAKTVSLTKKSNDFKELVKPLREMYGKLSFGEQSTFLVMVINEIRRGL